ncbi:MAG: hypothetical protein LBM75_04500 [Myxococcales bacterium]|jgi:hypothetical protein|nr:hypothetical protein [Myxococcales bacterium]
MTDSASKKRDPLLGAAVLKLSLRLANESEAPAYRFVYEGVLRDTGLTEADVDAYIEKNTEHVLKVVRGKERGEI